MSMSRILATELQGGVGARFDAANNRIVIAEFGGIISSASLTGGGRTVLGSGYVELEDLVLTDDGMSAVVTERAGNILKVDLQHADRTSASVVTSGLMSPHQLVLFESAGIVWVIENNVIGRLLEIDLASGTQKVLASGLEHAVGLVATADRSLAIITEQTIAGGRISALQIPGETRTVVADGLTNPFFLQWLNARQSEVILTERDPANRVSILQISQPPYERRLALLEASFRPSSGLLIGNELVVCADGTLTAYDVAGGYPAQVSIKIRHDSLYVGSYRRVPVNIGSSGISFEDLNFEVIGGRSAGAISYSRDSTYDVAHPEIMLLAGYKPGIHRLRAIHVPTNAIVGEAKFRLTDQWKDDDLGPSKWFNGILPSYTAGPTWGGGPVGSPQNFNTIPAVGTKRVAVLLVDTADQRYTNNATTLAGFRTRWQQNIIDGVVGADGVSRSVRRFYREASYQSIGLGGMDVTATIFPTVVNLSGNWTDYFQTDSNNLWAAKNEFINQCVTAAGDGVDLTGFDMIVCVSQAPGTGSPVKVAWPYGGYGINVDSSHGRVTGRGISMPNEWGDGSTLDQGGGRTIYETLSHEMGHTINLPDEYTPTVTGRNLAGNPLSNSSWDPMDLETLLPHFTLPHRLMLGWTQAPWIRLYNFQAAPGTTVDETITLSAVENGTPPPGQFAGIEIRIGDGRNYYAEYRIGQTGEIGDEQLAPNARVILVDVSEPPDPPVVSRPDMLLVPTHSDDNGAVLDSGQFYHETDNSTPTFPSDFRLDVVSHTGNQAVVRLRYGVIGKPDPSIRPWPRDAAHQWQSPDIEVRNARNASDPTWANVPWSGNNNSVVGLIKNRGTLSAPGVVANFFVKDYTVGGAPESFLGSDTHDIPPGATVEFSTNWAIPAPASPSSTPHFCIIVRIDHYQTPTSPPVQELTDANNTAQSNYDRFISATSTPSREITYVAAGNPYSKTTRFFIGAGQSNPLYRTYLEHSWFRLKPNEVQRIQAMFEFAPDAEQSDPDVNNQKDKFLRIPNFVNIVGLIEDPGDDRLHGPKLISGVTAEIVTGKSTRFKDLKNEGRQLFGVVTTRDDQPVPQGTVVITLRDKNGETLRSLQTKIFQAGHFSIIIDTEWILLDAYYIGPHGYADCETRFQNLHQ